MRKFIMLLTILGLLLITATLLFAQGPFMQPPMPSAINPVSFSPCANPILLREQIVCPIVPRSKIGPILKGLSSIAENINLRNHISFEFATRVTDICFRKGDYAGARRILLKILEIRPQSAFANFYIGLTYFEEGDLEKAIEYYLRAERINTRLLGLHSSLGYTNWLMDGNIDKLEKEVTLEINYNPANFEAYINRAIVYRNKYEDNEAAFRDYAKAVELSRNLEETVLIAARFSQQLKIHEDEGRKLLDGALKSNPKSWRAWEIKGGFYYNEGKYQESEQAYLRSLKLKKRSMTLYELCWTYVKMGRLDLAKNAYEEAKRLPQPDDPCYEFTAKQYLTEKGVVLNI